MKKTKTIFFCGICNKKVVNFTTFTDYELLTYFTKREAERICGSFRSTQLANQYETEKPTELNNKSFIYYIKKITVSVLSLLIAACGAKVEKKKEKKEEQSPEDTIKKIIDTIKHERVIIGEACHIQRKNSPYPIAVPTINEVDNKKDTLSNVPKPTIENLNKPSTNNTSTQNQFK